jgi:hypothetical protein
VDTVPKVFGRDLAVPASRRGSKGGGDPIGMPLNERLEEDERRRELLSADSVVTQLEGHSH